MVESLWRLDDLISEVRERPCLWDKRNPYFKNRPRSRVGWQEVSDALQAPVDEIRRKWKNLVDYFRAECKKIPRPRAGESEDKNVLVYKGKWEFFHQMCFMFGTAGGSRGGLESIFYLNEEEEDNSSEYLSEPVESFCAVSVADPEQTTALWDPDGGGSTRDDARNTSNVKFEEATSSNGHTESQCTPGSRCWANCSNKRVGCRRLGDVARTGAPPTKRVRPLSHCEQERLTVEQSNAETSSSSPPNETFVEEMIHRDADLCFFKSLLPFMNQLGNVEKLKMRQDITALFINVFASRNESPDV